MNYQVGNEGRSIYDLMDYQEGRDELSNFQVGKGNDMRLYESIKSSKDTSVQEGVLTDEREAEEWPHLYRYSYGVVGHVNEDDEKLSTSTSQRRNTRGVF
jgi:hypothetical protein